jgi:hypothetical protein
MRKLLISMADSNPAYREMLAVTAPSHAKYAAIHGYDYALASPHVVDGLREHRHPSWSKVQMLMECSRRQPNGFALFLDADVVVSDYSKDIIEDFPDGKKFGMVVHHTSDGAVPNCGVLACMGDCLDELQDIWDSPSFGRSQFWWEQAGMIHILGGDPDATPIAVPEGPLWGELPYEWNPHANDPRAFPPGLRFFHATMLADRVKALTMMRGPL